MQSNEHEVNSMRIHSYSSNSASVSDDSHDSFNESLPSVRQEYSIANPSVKLT